MKLPKLTKKPLSQVDGTPNEGLPLRILRAYLKDAKCMWKASGLTGNQKHIYEMMNDQNRKRAQVLERAIKTLSQKV